MVLDKPYVLNFVRMDAPHEVMVFDSVGVPRVGDTIMIGDSRVGYKVLMVEWQLNPRSGWFAQGQHDGRARITVYVDEGRFVPFGSYRG